MCNDPLSTHSYLPRHELVPFPLGEHCLPLRDRLLNSLEDISFPLAPTEPLVLNMLYIDTYLRVSMRLAALDGAECDVGPTVGLM